MSSVVHRRLDEGHEVARDEEVIGFTVQESET
jgi:hypothetical protein